MLENCSFEELKLSFLPKALGEYSTMLEDKLLLDVTENLNESSGEDLYTSLILMQMLAKNNPKMYSAIGDRYYSGIGFLKDENKALNFFDKASTNGGVCAKYDLAWYYYDHKEYMRACELFKACIDSQEELEPYMIPKCYACLGHSYMSLSDPKYQQAIEYLSIAADKYNNNFSRRKLGFIYSNSNNHFFDPQKAITHFSVAANNGDVYSAVELGCYHIFSNKEMGIEKNYATALNYILPFENSENVDILRYLGIIYMEGDTQHNIDADLEKAESYYEKAIKLDPDDYRSYADLGLIYYRLSKYPEAEKYLTMADNNGRCYYSDFLGRMYLEGILGQVDLGRAAHYYENAYKAGSINNVFTCSEYAELLSKIGNYQKAYEVADYGEEKYNDICFVFIKSELVLTDRVKNTIPKEEAARLMALCIEYDTETAKANFLLGNYNYSINNFRIAEKHYYDAFNAGYADAGVSLGRLNEYGGGTINPNPDLAYKWYVAAANNGSILGRNEASCFKKGIIGGYRRFRRL